MLCRRTCPSGGWRAGPIWRRWVMHLSWTTSREQHLLAQTPAARRVSHTGITWPSQKLQDQSAGSGYLTGNICFKSIQEKRFCLFLAVHLRRLCFLWFSLNHSTALKTQRSEIHHKDKSSRLCSVCVQDVYCLYVFPKRAVYTREYCVGYGIPWCNALDFPFLSFFLIYCLWFI